MTTDSDPPVLLDRVQTAEGEVDVIERRLYMLKAFVAELEKVTRGKEFRIWNGGVWVALLDSRDQLVISLASWCKAQWSKGGLFGQIGAHHLGELGRRLPKEAKPVHGEIEGRDGAFGRLFPAAGKAGRHAPTPDDVECLRNAFLARIEGSGLMSDRSDNRAHPFERKSGTAAMLDLPQLGALFEYVHRLLNDLRLLCDRSTRSYNDVYDCGSGSSPEDLVDLVLCGNIGRMWLVWEVKANATEPGSDRRWWWQHRLAYYGRIHDAHDKRAASAGAPFFNDLPAKEVQ